MEVKYILPPSGPIFHVIDHVGWAIKNMFPEYSGKGHDWEEWEIIYDKLRNKGYHTLVWMPATDELYIRTPIRQLSPSHKRRIGDLADKLAEKGYSYKVELIDDEGDSEILWKQPDMSLSECVKKWQMRRVLPPLSPP